MTSLIIASFGLKTLKTKPKKGQIPKYIKPATVNREHSYLRAVFNELKNLGYWKHENPLETIRQFKEQDAELCYYNKRELKILFKYLNDSKSRHVAMVAKVCLAVGCRWEEAATLKKEQIKNGRIQLVKTKSGKRRIIPIAAEFEQQLLSHPPHSRFRLFADCMTAFKVAVQKSGLPSPEGQLTHVLRHSFAVRFMERNGNLVELQQALGHSSITTTAIYLRFAPDHMINVPLLNPLNELDV